jgi:hypothetical protein
MVVFWRGWGFLVPLIMFAWVFVAVGFMIATASPEGNPNAAAYTDRLFTVVFALSAGSVYVMDRWRRRPTPDVDPTTAETHLLVHEDHFMFVLVKYYVWIFAAIAVFMAAKSFGE